MIVRVGREPRFQCRRVDRRCRRGNLERSAGACDLRFLRHFVGEAVEDLPRFFRFPCRDQGTHESADHLWVIRRHLADLPENVRCTCRIAIG